MRAVEFSSLLSKSPKIFIPTLSVMRKFKRLDRFKVSQRDHEIDVLIGFIVPLGHSTTVVFD